MNIVFAKIVDVTFTYPSLLGVLFRLYPVILLFSIALIQTVLGTPCSKSKPVITSTKPLLFAAFWVSSAASPFAETSSCPMNYKSQ